MAVSLEIPDGVPWWLSPDIWTVPGSDPNGPQGMPVAGQPCYVWAHVLNTGTDLVDNATVNFYWADPSTAFDRTTATLIGTSYVSLAANDAADVLCLTTWVPSFVNGGHECLLAEAFHPTLDPLPATPAFNVPTDRHVAQRNLSVLQVAGKMLSFAFEAHNTLRVPRNFTLRTRSGNLEEIAVFAKQLGLKLPKKPGTVDQIAFTTKPCPTEVDERLKTAEVRVEIGPKERKGYSIVGQLEGEAAVVHVEQLVGERVVGGLSILALLSPANGTRK